MYEFIGEPGLNGDLAGLKPPASDGEKEAAAVDGVIAPHGIPPPWLYAGVAP